MLPNELKRELRQLLRKAKISRFRYAAIVVHRGPELPDEIVILPGRKVQVPAPGEIRPANGSKSAK